MYRRKLAIIVSHPIQYQCPFFRELAKEPDIDLTVYFSWDAAARQSFSDPEFGKEIQWDIPLLEGYRHIFLKNISPKPSSGFWGQVNFGIVKALRQERYNALLVFGWNSLTNWLAVLTASFIGLPIFLRGENPLSHEGSKGAARRFVKSIVLGWLFRRVIAFLFIGKENKKFYTHYGVPESKMIFCPYAVDNARFMSEAARVNRDAARNALGIARDEVMIIFAGKLIAKKRPFDLLHAYERMYAQKKALVFVGDGELRSDLEAYARDHALPNVHFAGFKNQSEIGAYYACADIFVLPSGVGETWGLAVNEAMCFGLPVVVSEMVGCGLDLVRNGENGYIIPLGAAGALASALDDLAMNQEKRRAWGKRSLEIIGGYTYSKDIEGVRAALARL